MSNIEWLLLDWGDTLMLDNPKNKGEMYLWPEIVLMSGVAETLPLLAKKYNCAVVSNASDSNAETMKKAFEKAKVERHIDLFITSKEIGYKKPDKEFFVYISDFLKTPINMLCMIGNDYENDIVTPKMLGMSTILISPFSGDYPLSDKVITDFSELKSIL